MGSHVGGATLEALVVVQTHGVYVQLLPYDLSRGFVHEDRDRE